MDASFRPFVRFISEKNMRLLEEAATGPEGAWLRDALGDPKLFFALRDERIDVYYRGRALYSIEFSGGRVIPKTHVKYLILDGGDQYIKMRNGSFDYKRPYLQGVYQEKVSLRQMKAAARTFSGVESIGVYDAINKDPFVIDVEVAFNRSSGSVTERDDLEAGRKQDRIDVVRLRKKSEGVDLVFWEAKHFSNSELFNDKILNQLAAYEKQLQAREDQLLTAFQNVCAFHVSLSRLRKNLGFDGASDVHLEMLEGLASGSLPLNVVKEPSLFVFGFDSDQKNGRWKARKQHIEAVIGKDKKRLRDVGNASEGF